MPGAIISFNVVAAHDGFSSHKKGRILGIKKPGSRNS